MIDEHANSLLFSMLVPLIASIYFFALIETIKFVETRLVNATNSLVRGVSRGRTCAFFYLLIINQKAH